MRNPVDHLICFLLNKWSQYYIKSNPSLLHAIEAAEGKSSSTGIGLNSYAALHMLIRKYRPKTVLECGTGKSTFIIADALKLNDNNAILISVEDKHDWYEKAFTAFPFQSYPNVSIIHKPIRIINIGMFRGYGYGDLPAHDYDLVVVDGPTIPPENDIIDGCNMQFIEIASNSSIPVACIVDKRLTTVAMHNMIFGHKHNFSSSYFSLSVTRPVSKDNSLKYSKDRKIFRQFNWDRPALFLINLYSKL